MGEPTRRKRRRRRRPRMEKSKKLPRKPPSLLKQEPTRRKKKVTRVTILKKPPRKPPSLRSWPRAKKRLALAQPGSATIAGGSAAPADRENRGASTAEK